jgi:Ca2+-binding EF-hand superfamily protein
MPQFSRFFEEFDVNGDGVLSKIEMARFVKLFLKEDKDRMIEDVVKNLFLKFDVDRSGFLEKRETLKLLDEILGQKRNASYIFTAIQQILC